MILLSGMVEFKSSQDSGRALSSWLFFIFRFRQVLSTRWQVQTLAVLVYRCFADCNPRKKKPERYCKCPNPCHDVTSVGNCWVNLRWLPWLSHKAVTYYKWQNQWGLTEGWLWIEKKKKCLAHRSTISSSLIGPPSLWSSIDLKTRKDAKIDWVGQTEGQLLF